jgi:hypothetical protein
MSPTSEVTLGDSVEVKKVSDSVGFGVFSRLSARSGDKLFRDLPLVSIQHTANRRFVKACQHCHKPLGSTRDQLATIFSEERFYGVDLTPVPENQQANNSVFCECGEVYCSPECGAAAFKKHHYSLCVARNGRCGEAVAEYKFYCLSIDGCGDNLLLLAQLLALFVSRAEGSYEKFEGHLAEMLTYTNRPFNEVTRPPTGAERDEEWNEWLESTITQAFDLLSSALAPQNEVFGRFFANREQAYNILSRLLSVFELNNIDLAIPSKLGEELTALANAGYKITAILKEKEVVMRLLWNDEARGIYEDGEEGSEYEDAEMDDQCAESECGSAHHDEGYVDDMIASLRDEVSTLSLQDLLKCENPSFHGTGFFPSVARTNHSCNPNVVMDFDDGCALVTCKALRPIAQGEELRMSYIGRPDEKAKSARQAQLKDYLFDCSCEKCLSE